MTFQCNFKFHNTYKGIFSGQIVKINFAKYLSTQMCIARKHFFKRVNSLGKYLQGWVGYPKMGNWFNIKIKYIAFSELVTLVTYFFRAALGKTPGPRLSDRLHCFRQVFLNNMNNVCTVVPIYRTKKKLH